MKGYDGLATFGLLSYYFTIVLKIGFLSYLIADADVESNQLISMQPPFWE